MYQVLILTFAILNVFASAQAASWAYVITADACFTAGSVVIACNNPLAVSRTVGFTISRDGIAVESGTLNLTPRTSDDAVHHSIRHRAWMRQYPASAPDITIGTPVVVPK